MSVFVDRSTRVLVQGMTGSAGSFHTEQMMDYGTRVVAGVTPNRGGTRFRGTVPIFHTVEAAVRETGADATAIFVPPPYAADAIIEAAEAGIRLIVCITEGIPVLDMVRVRRYVESKGTSRLIGPNCPGVITPGECKIGIMPGHIHRPGRIGVVSRSGTLTYEAVKQLSDLGLGQSSAVGIGGDPVHGTGFVEVLEEMEKDPGTEAVVMIGEIGGIEEERAASFVREHMTKPVVGFIAGRTAPPGKRMGHAGAVITGGSGTAEAKIAAMREAGITVVEGPHLLGRAMKDVLVRAPPRKPTETPRRSMSTERTLSIIKPDGVEKGIIGRVISRFESSGLKPVAIKMKQLTRTEAEGFYAVHRGRPFFDDLVMFMTSGPVVLMVLEGEGAVVKNREIMGATDPKKAADGTIRKEFATSIEKNTVHGSDSPENARIEVAYFFPEIEMHRYEWGRRSG